MYEQIIETRNIKILLPIGASIFKSRSFYVEGVGI